MPSQPPLKVVEHNHVFRSNSPIDGLIAANLVARTLGMKTPAFGAPAKTTIESLRDKRSGDIIERVTLAATRRNRMVHRAPSFQFHVSQRYVGTRDHQSDVLVEGVNAVGLVALCNLGTAVGGTITLNDATQQHNTREYQAAHMVKTVNEHDVGDVTGWLRHTYGMTFQRPKIRSGRKL